MNRTQRYAIGVTAILALLLRFMPVVQAANQVVTKAADSGAGSLRQAIADVHDGGTITFDLPVYVIGIVLTSGPLLIDKNMTITGPGADELFVSGNDSSRVFIINGTTVTISGLTISDGQMTALNAMGGGILNMGDLTLRQVTVRENTARGISGGGSAGGGGILSTGPLRLVDCLIEQNDAYGGDGPGSVAGGVAFGGGVYMYASSGQFLDTTFRYNGSYGVSQTPGPAVMRTAEPSRWWRIVH